MTADPFCALNAHPCALSFNLSPRLNAQMRLMRLEIKDNMAIPSILLTYVNSYPYSGYFLIPTAHLRFKRIKGL